MSTTNRDLLSPLALRNWVREQILAAAKEHVSCCATVAAALNEANVAVEVEAFELLAGLLGKPVLTQPQRRALTRAVVAEARKQAEAALDSDDHPEAWGTARKSLEAALDRNTDMVAACDECDGQGKGCHCHGGLVVAPADVTALAIRLRDEAIDDCWKVQREPPALVEVSVEPIAEVA